MYYSTLIKFSTQHFIWYRWGTGSLRMRNAVRSSPEESWVFRENHDQQAPGAGFTFGTPYSLPSSLSGILSSPFRYPVPKFFFLYLNRDVCDIIMNSQRNYCLLTHNFTVKIQISWFQGNFFLSIIPSTVDYYMTDSLKPNPIMQFYRYFLSTSPSASCWGTNKNKEVLKECSLPYQRKMQTIITILNDKFNDEVAQGKHKFLNPWKSKYFKLGNQESLQESR